MQIVPAVPEDFPRLKEFLLPYEPYCVQLCSYVRKGLENLFVIKDDKDDAGVIYAKGTLLHCIPDFESCESELSKVLGDFLRTHPVKCINGTSSVTEKIKSILQVQGRTCSQTNLYQLMSLSCETSPVPPEESLYNDDIIRRCANAEHDSDILFELQKAYIKEEVAPAGKNPGDLEISVVLKQIIKNQICLALFSDGEAVAKANTNAIGWNCVQLGGIYTHPLYRKNGYAHHLVYNLCKRILKAGKTATLYVKGNNLPAASLYKKIGFKKNCGFEIAYFE